MYHFVSSKAVCTGNFAVRRPRNLFQRRLNYLRKLCSLWTDPPVRHHEVSVADDRSLVWHVKLR